MRYGDRAVLREISLEFAPPSLTVIAGPNGAGKSTLLGILSGLREDYTGECFFDSTEVRKWHRRDFARRVSLVPQATRIEFPFSAEEVVLMGRAPHASGLFESSRDRAVAHEAMDLTETWHLRARDFRSLSGGEQQRVVLASALAQSPEALLLDEPTTYLDVRHQVALYRVMRTLSGRGVLVVAVTHDLNLAAAYAQRVILLSEGVVAADGPPEYAFHPERIRAVFGVPAELLHAPDGRAWLRYAD
jgi:iron complex transport system ATP-binding protein